MRINITTSNDPAAKKKLAAATFEAVGKLLTDNSEITIQVDGKIKMSELAEALRSISEIVEAGASVLNSAEEDPMYDADPDDPADFWKKPGADD
ncbi:MAG: hypothetical protein ACTSYO_08155 [Candidatus Ranarchaeia archaeon]